MVGGRARWNPAWQGKVGNGSKWCNTGSVASARLGTHCCGGARLGSTWSGVRSILVMHGGMRKGTFRFVLMSFALDLLGPTEGISMLLLGTACPVGVRQA